VETEVKALLEGALAAAIAVVDTNRELHTSMSEKLAEDERLDGPPLVSALEGAQAPDALLRFVLYGELPDFAGLRALQLRAGGDAAAAGAAAAGLGAAMGLQVAGGVEAQRQDGGGDRV
jgi:hypothetical protein